MVPDAQGRTAKAVADLRDLTVSDMESQVHAFYTLLSALSYRPKQRLYLRW